MKYLDGSLLANYGSVVIKSFKNFNRLVFFKLPYFLHRIQMVNGFFYYPVFPSNLPIISKFLVYRNFALMLTFLCRYRDRFIPVLSNVVPKRHKLEDT